jgi:hypothetical protein
MEIEKLFFHVAHAGNCAARLSADVEGIMEHLSTSPFDPKVPDSSDTYTFVTTVQ